MRIPPSILVLAFLFNVIFVFIFGWNGLWFTPVIIGLILLFTYRTPFEQHMGEIMGEDTKEELEKRSNASNNMFRNMGIKHFGIFIALVIILIIILGRFA